MLLIASDPFHTQGRLLNRFSKDMEFCDSMLPQTFHDTLQCLLMVIASVGLCVAMVHLIALDCP